MRNFLKSLNHQLIRKFRSSINYKLDKNFTFVDDLRENGCHIQKEFSKKNNLAHDIINQFEKIPKEKITSIIQNYSNNSGRYNYRKYITNFFDNKLLLEYANQNLFKDNFKQYFGLEPKIRFISVWLDFPTLDNNEKNSQIFHRDTDDIYLVKTFLCLTNINMENGPFEFIKTSHKKPWDQNVNNYLKTRPSLVKTFSLNKGDLYMADTNGFHRGKILSKDYRVLLNVHYVSSKPRVGFLDKIIN